MSVFNKSLKSCILYDGKLLVILFSSLVLRIILSNYYSYYPDLNTFQFWSLDMIRYGFKSLYQISKVDYLPGYMYILWATGKVFCFINAKLFFIKPEIVFKLPSIFADVALGLLVYFIFFKNHGAGKALMTSSLFLFNPAFIFNSTLWGQVESFLALFLVLSVILYNSKKYILASIILAFAQVIKPIAILIFPFYLIKLCFERKIKYMLLTIMTFITSIVIFFIPFSSGNIFLFILQRYMYTVRFWGYVTLNAFSFWSGYLEITRGTIDKITASENLFGLSFSAWGIMIFIILYMTLLFIFVRMIKIKYNNQDLKTFILYGLSFNTMFLFLTGLHERHLYYAMLFYLLAWPLLNGKLKFIWFVQCGVYILNLLFSYSEAGLVGIFLSDTWILILVLINLIIYLNLFIYIAKRSSMAFIK